MKEIVDLGLIGALHLHRVGHDARERVHEAFQTSTLAALLDRRYHGDELPRGHGDAAAVDRIEREG